MGGTVSLPSPQYIDVRYPDNKLAFRYDPTRAIVEIRGTPRSERADTEMAIIAESQRERLPAELHDPKERILK